MLTTAPHVASDAAAAHGPLLSLITHTRGVMLHAVKQSIGRQDVTDTCGFACALLASLLQRFCGVAPRFCGGGPQYGTGLLMPTGQRAGHYWLEVVLDGRVWVVDITADQFGWPPIVFCPKDTLADIYSADPPAMSAAAEAVYRDLIGAHGT